MFVLYGSGVGKGIAIGKAFVLHRDRVEIPEYVLPKYLLDEEVERFHHAVQQAREQLTVITQHIPEGAPPETAGFIDAHLLMLEDRMLLEATIKTIREERYNAEWALKLHSDTLIAVFDKMEDPYLRNKKIDIHQVVDRVQRNLLMVQDQEHDRVLDGLDGHIVVANDLTPADTVMLKNHHIGAFVTNLGSPISHTAILARGLRIPAIVGLHGAVRYIRDGDSLIIDGKQGSLIIDPDDRLLREFRAHKRQMDRLRAELQTLKSSLPVTQDAQQIDLMANIELPGDIKAVKKVAAAGVGLYRTEYLFMNKGIVPTESDHYNAYIRVIKSMGGRPITIRTMDLGTDKQVSSITESGNQGVNPALGLRAIRLCLQDPQLFKPQLRAILRASAHGKIRLMIPMISSLDELDQTLDLIEEVKRELDRKHQKFDPDLPVGGMIEVPAAAISADLFAEHLDFLSIGTNDLIQYTLAIDRIDDTVNYLYDPLHPSVLRLIKMTIDAGNKANIPVAMCGEMAGDTTYTRLLLGMGLRNFSMDAENLLEIKKIVIGSDSDRLAIQAKQVLQATSSNEVHRLVHEINQENG